MQQGLLYLIQDAQDQQQYLDVDPTQLDDLYLMVHVSRNNVVNDMRTQVMQREDLKSPLKVELKGEVGVDDGGIKKELLQILVKELCGNRNVICVKGGNKYHWFNHNTEDLKMCEFVGVIVGLALYNGVMLDLKFPLLLYKKLLLNENQTLNSLEQLLEIQPDFYKTFRYMLQTNQSLQPMQLHFTADNIVQGKRTSIPLTHKGELIRVTQHNKNQYIQLYLKYLIDKQISSQFNAFKLGFYRVIDKQSISLFEPHQLQLALCGLETIDFTQLQKSAKYQSYSPASPVVTWFWDLLDHLPQQRKKQFLFFATGSDRSPIGGLSTLSFTIQRHGSDTENVLSAHTCSNVLLLPEYSNKEKLRKKLGIALSHNHGFGLM